MPSLVCLHGNRVLIVFIIDSCVKVKRLNLGAMGKGLSGKDDVSGILTLL